MSRFHALPFLGALFLGALSLTAFPASQASAQVLMTPEKTANDIITELADIAGGAAYCEIEQEKQDLFLNLAHAKIASFGGDSAAKVINKINFSTLLTSTSSKEPLGGCTAFLPIFENALARLD